MTHTPNSAALPPHLASLRLRAEQATVRHPVSAIDEHPTEGEPDLFRLLPPSARRAFDLGVLASDPWFHVFVEAPPDVDVLGAITSRATRRLRGRGVPHDVVYVHDFEHPSAPQPLLLPAGAGPVLAETVRELLEAIKQRLPELEADEGIRSARASLAKQLKDRQKSVITELESLAKGLSFGIKNVPGGVQTFPILHGKPVSSEQFAVLDNETKKQLEEAEEKLSNAIESAAERVSSKSRDLDEKSRALEEKIARELVEGAAAPALERFADVPPAREYLERIVEELITSLDDLVASIAPRRARKKDREEEETTDPEIATRLSRFAVNVFVTHGPEIELGAPTAGANGDSMAPPSAEAGGETSAKTNAARPGDAEATADEGELDEPSLPVVFEDNPTFANLFGYLERRVRLGALVSDFTRIRPGALHKASGGVLVLRAADVLGDALAWDRLKRVLRARAVGHEDPIGPMGLYATTLRPRPCPIATKVVLVGPHDLYATLLEADPDFGSLFRVKVEIPPSITRVPENIRAMDAHLCQVATARGWGPLDRGARARALDYAVRLAEDQRRLTLALQPIEEALAFATVIAIERSERQPHVAARLGRKHRQRASEPPPAMPASPRLDQGRSLPPPPPPHLEHDGVIASDLDAAWQERRDRSASAERELREMVVEGEVLVLTEGQTVGAVNGLSVLSAGDVQFGHPMRITAVVSLGTEGLIDVEREASLGGALHTKGVAILRGFLSGTFGQERPLALRAQIAFEQSYGEVEGDSASSTELYAILSALADVPINQSIAVTGSVNQFGEVQAIGGVTAKIEGFFDLCAARGLTGQQGVIIPRASVPHLVLRDDVVDAIAAGRFSLFAVEHVTQGIEILTGIPAGARDASGRYPAGSVFGRVERRLIEIAERLRRAESVGMPGGEDEGPLDEGEEDDER